MMMIERGDWLKYKVVDAVNNLVAKHLQSQTAKVV